MQREGVELPADDTPQGAAIRHAHPRWLTELWYPTKASEPRSAKSQKVVLGCVPRTEDVMALFERLQAEFPGAELEGLLADE